MRSLILLLGIIALFFIVRAVIQRFEQFQQKMQQEDADTSSSQMEEKMVACEICQVHLPENEALCTEEVKESKGYQEGQQGQRHCFCSKEHLEQFIEEHS